MSNACVETKKVERPVRRHRSIYQVHYALLRRPEEEMAKPFGFSFDSRDFRAYDQQVAGHKSTEDKKYLGLLQCPNGTILKPILKECQKREVDFYERLISTENPDLVELRKFIPKYFGCRRFTYHGYEQEYIILEHLAERMLEPCIMDVKIGKRTWDPLASEEKIKNEQKKYALSKQEFGFCIPGYHVYKITSGRLQKYNKDHGKRLHGSMVRDAIRNFLNGMGTILCRALILQFLSELWKIQRWCSHQRSVHLYSASLLLVYDATRLRECCGVNSDELIGRPKCQQVQLTRRKSFHSMHSLETGSNFSGQISSKGPVYKKVNSVPLTSMALAQSVFSSPPPINSPWSDALDKLNHNHSFDHNYEDKLSKIRMNYRAILDQLSSDTPTPRQWGTVKIIDFAHAFFNKDDDMTIDENFKEGIDNVVAIFESFLAETDDQVF